MDCYLCDQDATQRCPRCGNPYCGDHGEDLCSDCLNPVNAAPSSTFFRASLLALLLGSVLALWLLIRPPGLPGESSEVILPEASPQPVTPSPPIPPTPIEPTLEPTLEPTPEPTLEPTAEPTPVPTVEPEGPIEYVVQEGDTISGIAAFFGFTVEDLLAINGLTEQEAEMIQPGDVLAIPQ